MIRGLRIVLVWIICIAFPVIVNGQWAVIKSFPTEIFDIYFLNRDTGYVCGGTNDGILMMTEDGGETWTTVITSATDFFRAVCFVSPDTGFLSTSGLGERIFRTIDGGATWTETFSSSPPIYDICFPTHTTGYISPSIMEYQSVKRSEDAGAIWQDAGSFVTLQSGMGTMDLDFPELNTGYMALDAGYIYKTVNGGNDWAEKYSTDDYRFRALQFFAPDTGYAIGTIDGECLGINCGLLLKTLNGGETWDHSYVNPEIYEVEFTDPDTGYIGSNGILKTNDGGLTWEMEPGTNIGEVTKIDFPDPGMGYALARQTGQAWLLKRNPLTGILDYPQNKIASMTLFPNPTSDEITLSGCFTKGSVVRFEFRDVTGRCVFARENIKTFHGYFRETISVESFRSGIYLVRTVSENQTVTKTVFIY